MKALTQGMTWNTGRIIALGVGAVLADTGALPAGVYDIEINLAVSDVLTAGVGAFVEHRNAANAATLKDLGGQSPGGGSVKLRFENYRLALNERIRVVGGGIVGGANSVFVGAIGYARVAAE